ncbi:GNAT family N-acetyltransferase [Lignipirellula cremea]|uniref:TDP-fucosamine acetyltransferase n=1 Tax=Lignipirellula cremea TaxID=2528010 RepID=A0A518E311_9BACT|nr:GNAT family N-acetyltransferase [Lignipirellula cremea]QDU98485.1 TDP-fucosamine acetyltransferase [Lignipirellula cremea]
MITLREESFGALERYASVPSTYETDRIFDVDEQGGSWELRERRLERPYRKDYDAVESPHAWPLRFDVTGWTLIGAFDGQERVGGAVAAFATPGLDMLAGRRDLVVLWDLRVLLTARRIGVGSALFRAIEAWAVAKQCRELRVETQNTNLAACRFYASQGCRLFEVNRNAYAGLPEEVQLLWSKAL